MSRCVDVDTLDRFISAGFDVTVTGSDVGVVDGAAGVGADGDGPLTVEEDVFMRWLGLSEMQVSIALSRSSNHNLACPFQALAL